MLVIGGGGGGLLGVMSPKVIWFMTIEKWSAGLLDDDIFLPLGKEKTC